MEIKGINISKKDYERLTEIEKNFNDRVENFKASIGFYQEIISIQNKTISNQRRAFVIMFVAWLIQLILYIAK